MYRALLDHQVDIVAGNSTDGILAARDLTILQDDKHYFPPYEAVPIIRQAKRWNSIPKYKPPWPPNWPGKISDAQLQKMNYAVDGEHKDAAEVVRNFLRTAGLS